jgi:hypothetical protein
VWYQGSKSATCEGITLDLQFQQQLGKGGFGAVHKVLVKATGANSLAGLKLTGPLSNSLKTLVKEGRTKGNVGRGAAAVAAGGSSRQQSARSRAGSKGGGSNGGSVGSNGAGGGSWVPMALKVALGFEQLSREMQDNFREAPAFDTNVQQVSTAAVTDNPFGGVGSQCRDPFSGPHSIQAATFQHLSAFMLVMVGVPLCCVPDGLASCSCPSLLLPALRLGPKPLPASPLAP